MIVFSDNNNIRNLANPSEIINNNITQYEPNIQTNKINTRLYNKSSKSKSKSTQIKIEDRNTKIEYRNRKINEKEITSNFRPVPKKSGTTVHIRRTLSGNDTLIGGLAPQEGRTQKIKTIGHKKIRTDRRFDLVHAIFLFL